MRMRSLAETLLSELEYKLSLHFICCYLHARRFRLGLSKTISIGHQSPSSLRFPLTAGRTDTSTRENTAITSHAKDSNFGISG
ncbi:unnamed protein product [Boreogadus saida]